MYQKKQEVELTFISKYVLSSKLSIIVLFIRRDNEVSANTNTSNTLKTEAFFHWFVFITV